MLVIGGFGYGIFHRGGCNNRDFLIKFHLFKGRGGYIFSLFNFRSRLFVLLEGQRFEAFFGMFKHGSRHTDIDFEIPFSEPHASAKNQYTRLKKVVPYFCFRSYV